MKAPHCYTREPPLRSNAQGRSGSRAADSRETLTGQLRTFDQIAGIRNNLF